MRYLLFIFIGLVVASCSSESVSSTTEDASPNVTTQILSGSTWKTKCTIASDGSSYIAKVLFNSSGSAATSEIAYYSDMNCQLGTFTYREKADNFIVGNKSEVSGYKVTKYTDQMTDLTIELTSYSYVTNLNQGSFCGISSWTLNQEISIAGKTCSSTTYPAKGYGYRNVIYYASDASYIMIGNTASLDAEGYPSALAGEEYYKQ